MLNVMQIEQAFQGGYDPALELAVHAKKSLDDRHMADTTDEVANHMRRKEQDIIDRIIHGDESGRYFMILGCKVSPLWLCSCAASQPSPYAGNWKNYHDIGCNAS